MRALNKWLEIFMTLELDKKSQLDLLLLAQAGEAGRSEANEIMWTLLSIWALKTHYEDLSNKVSQLVNKHRRFIDRPPKWATPDLMNWQWKCYWVPRHPEWAPRAVPPNCQILTSPHGIPLAPPRCWGPQKPRAQ